MSNRIARRPARSLQWQFTGINDVKIPLFLELLNSRDTAYTYRLPTEAEWEYAARAGTTGDRYADLDDIAWHAGNSNKKIQPIGTKAANAWGFYDMLGKRLRVGAGYLWSVSRWVGHRSHRPRDRIAPTDNAGGQLSQRWISCPERRTAMRKTEAGFLRRSGFAWPESRSDTLDAPPSIRWAGILKASARHALTSRSTQTAIWTGARDPSPVRLRRCRFPTRCWNWSRMGRRSLPDDAHGRPLARVSTSLASSEQGQILGVMKRKLLTAFRMFHSQVPSQRLVDVSWMNPLAVGGIRLKYRKIHVVGKV